MMMYADYTFYLENWKSIIHEEEFSYYANLAIKNIDYYTFDRLTALKPDEITKNIKFCQCELMNYLFNNDKVLNANRSGVKSTTVDTYKIEYNVSTSQSYQAENIINTQMAIYNICQQYLASPINYMYVGV